MTVKRFKINRRIIGLAEGSVRIEESNDDPISVLEDHDWSLNGKNRVNGSTRDRLIEYENRVRNLESSLQRAREESFQAGFEEGKEIGIKEIRVQIDNLSKEFVSATGSLDSQYRQTLQKLGKPLVRLSIKIAEKILDQELKHADVYDAVVKRQIGKLLSEVTDQNKITIYLNPKQISNIARVENQGQERLSGAVNFVGKDDLRPGECVVETEDYILEGLINRQLQNIENRMLSQETIE